MIAFLRIVLALTVFVLLTLPLALAQWIALATGWCSESLIPRLWHRLILRCLGMRVKVSGALSSHRPLLVAANHVSWTDIMVLGAHADVRFIAKSDVARWPGWGTVARLNRTVFVEREKPSKTGHQASEIAERMAAGDAMVLFPEGTTADGNFLLPFKTSLFGAATLALSGQPQGRLFIQPVSISYTRLQGVAMSRSERALASWAGAEGLWPHVIRLLSTRAVDAQLIFGEAVEFTAATGRKQAARDVESAVRTMFSQTLAEP